MRLRFKLLNVFPLGMSALSLSCCAVVPKMEQRLPIFDKSASAPAPPRASTASPGAPPAETAEPQERLIYSRGVRGSLSRDAAVAGELAEKTVTLGFANAPAADVARAVISETLGETVAVADGVTGTISLTAAGEIPADEALALLESVLAESGLALLRTQGGYLLTTLAKAGEEPSQVSRGAAVGYGVAFAPVRNALPSELANLIKPFVSSRVTITPDDSRSALLLKGPNTDIAAAREAIETFDTPHLIDRTFGMFRLQYADAASLKGELQSVLAVSSAKGAGEILPLPRLNLLFVTARTRDAFDEIRDWIERLDQPSGGDARRLRYYPVQNTAAEKIAEQLSSAISGIVPQPSTPATGENAGSSVQPTFRGTAAISGGGAAATISTDTLNNALIIRSTDQEYREIVALIERMDVAAPQVLIEATIAEVTLNEALSFGVRWFLENAESRVTLSDNAAGAVAAVFPGLSYTFIETDARIALSALASVTDVSVISAPSIMVLNNQTANLQVGDEVPIVTQQAQSVIDPDAPIVSTLQLRETGVILEVKPRINASDIVVLEVTQEVSDVTPTTTSGIDSPTIQQRRFTSTVAVRNNGTIALGGLIRENFTDNDSGVPIFKDIPLLGNAFKSRDITKRRTELVVFLTPRIIRTDEDARASIQYVRREMTRLGQDPAPRP